MKLELAKMEEGDLLCSAARVEVVFLGYLRCPSQGRVAPK